MFRFYTKHKFNLTRPNSGPNNKAICCFLRPEPLEKRIFMTPIVLMCQEPEKKLAKPYPRFLRKIGF